MWLPSLSVYQWAVKLFPCFQYLKSAAMNILEKEMATYSGILP